MTLWENIYRKNIFLDDERHPFDIDWGEIRYELYSWYIVRNYEDFIEAVKTKWPEIVSVDNDIQQEKEGYDCLKWLLDYALENNLNIPHIYFHSKNPVAVENMKSYLSSFIKHNAKKD